MISLGHPKLQRILFGELICILGLLLCILGMLICLHILGMRFCLHFWMHFCMYLCILHRLLCLCILDGPGLCLVLYCWGVCQMLHSWLLKCTAPRSFSLCSRSRTTISGTSSLMARSEAFASPQSNADRISDSSMVFGKNLGSAGCYLFDLHLSGLDLREEHAQFAAFILQESELIPEQLHIMNRSCVFWSGIFYLWRVFREIGSDTIGVRRDCHLKDRLSGYAEVFSPSLILIAFHQPGSLQHLQMVDDRFGPHIQPFSHLIEVKGTEGEELEDAPPIFISQNVQELNRIQYHHSIISY